MLATSPLRVYMVFLVAGALILPGPAMAQHGEVDPLPGDAADPVPPPTGEDPEPNGNQYEAVPIPVGPDGLTVIVRGILGNHGSEWSPDIDCYIFEVPAGAPFPMLLTVSVDGEPSVDVAVRVRFSEPSWRRIAANDDIDYPANLDAEVRTYLFSEGTCVITVLSTVEPPMDQGAYILQVGLRAAELPASDLEPNDDFATATDAGSGPYQVTGEFIGDGPLAGIDVDVYKLTLAAPRIIFAEVRAQPGDTIFNPALTLANTEGVIAVNDDADLGTRDAQIRAAVFAGGEYYVTVFGAGREGPVSYMDGIPGSLGYYDLSVEVRPLVPPDRLGEPNDSILEATWSGLAFGGQVTLPGYVGDGRFAATRGDVDIYHAEAWHGSLVTVDVDAAKGGSPLDSVVVVLDHLGTVIAANDNDGATTDSLVTFEARQPGADDPADFYVMVLGTGQARPADPFVPNPDTTEVRPSEHVVVKAFPSIGPYEFSIDIVCAHGCNNCCVPHDGPGCTVREIETCVCDHDPSCCTGNWDDDCVDRVVWHDCGQCPPEPTGPGQPNQLPARRPPKSDPPPHRVFATTVEEPPESIVEIDPDDGSVINDYPVPEHIVRVGQGLALLDDTLFYLGHGRFPWLYWLDADTGNVLTHTILWSGSGYYGDLAVLGNHLFVTDILNRSLHELDPVAVQAVRTLNVGALNGIGVSGALASLHCPERLYVAEAGETDAVHAIDPVTGLIDVSLSLGVPCPCNADFDGDGDVDADDQAFFDDCQTGDGSVQFFCHQADLDCDNNLDADDQAILDCQNNGPGSPPNDGCCPDDLPDVPLRADALGGSGSDRLYISEWRRETIELYLDGVLLEVFPMDSEIGAIGGQPFGDYPGEAEGAQGNVTRRPARRLGGNQP